MNTCIKRIFNGPNIQKCFMKKGLEWVGYNIYIYEELRKVG